MTRSDITWNVSISLFSALIGVILQPLLKSIWARLNKPAPLTPVTKGQLITSLAFAEDSLERLNHLQTHQKDLFLYFIQLAMASLFCLIAAAILYALQLFAVMPKLALSDAFTIVLLFAAGFFCVLAISEGKRMSDKQIESSKERIQKNIERIKQQLNAPL